MLRPQIVPLHRANAAKDDLDCAVPLPPKRPEAQRIDWASLLRRVFAVDILECGRCNGRMRVLAVIEEPAVVKQILVHLGLPAAPLETTRARAPPQPSLAFDAA